MDFLHQQQQLIQLPIELYYQCANQTQKYWLRDNHAALKIQSKYKMYMKRKQFKRMRHAAIKIQTQFRAHYARKQFKKQQLRDFNEKNLRYFSHHATIIQRAFRGFFVRKYIHNFYQRKQQLQALAVKNEQFRQSLLEFGQAQAIESQEYKKQLSKMQFTTLAQNLHHLTSTKAIPGVYNSPFMMEKPKVFEKQVEQHLKQGFKKSYRWRGVTRDDMAKHNTLKMGTIK